MHFDQFKEALILILSRTLSNEEHFQEPGKDSTCFLYIPLSELCREESGDREACLRGLGHLPFPDRAVIFSGLSFDIILKALQLLNTEMRLPTTTANCGRNNWIIPKQYVRWWE